MKLTASVTIASLLMYIWVFAKAGNARKIYQVPAPAMDGPAGFLAAMRVQANTVEQLVLFLPALWLCCLFLGAQMGATMGDQIAAGLGALWVVGRVIYALGYYQAPAKRGLGFGISSLATLGLLIGAIAGLILH